jgi:hypothetical protein
MATSVTSAPVECETTTHEGTQKPDVPRGSFGSRRITPAPVDMAAPIWARVVCAAYSSRCSGDQPTNSTRFLAPRESSSSCTCVLQ